MQRWMGSRQTDRMRIGKRIGSMLHSPNHAVVLTVVFNFGDVSAALLGEIKPSGLILKASGLYRIYWENEKTLIHIIPRIVLLRYESTRSFLK